MEQAEKNMQKDKEIETMVIREGSDNTLVT